MTLSRVRILSPNYSSRGGARVRLIVIHSSEGAQTYQSLGNFFANPSSQVSSHTGIDDASPNTVGEYVDRGQKAWTAANANPYSIQTELCTPSGASANWSLATWQSKTNMLATLAQWIREEAAAFGIPIVGLTPAQAQGGSAGVCQHKDLGSMGGGHVDCGPNFPFAQVIQMAQTGTAPGPGPKPEPEPEPEEPDMIAPPCSFNMNDVEQTFYVDANGNMIHGYGPAGKPWVTENLGGGWDKTSGVSHNTGPGGTEKVWAIRSNGKGAQVYWNGKNWLTQPLP
jgi:N-acetylmuramoyl-L-alanine amidase